MGTVFWYVILIACLIFGGLGIYFMASPKKAAYIFGETPDAISSTGRIFMIVSIVVIALLLMFTKSCSGCSGGNSDSSSTTCKVCNQTFKKGSDNAKSISRRNMCENCYENYQWRQEVQDYIDNQPIN